MTRHHQSWRFDAGAGLWEVPWYSVVAKVERLAKVAGTTKTAIVERAVDRLAGEIQGGAAPGRMAALLSQLDRIPDRADAFDPLTWDEHGLPR